MNYDDVLERGFDVNESSIVVDEFGNEFRDEDGGISVVYPIGAWASVLIDGKSTAAKYVSFGQYDAENKTDEYGIKDEQIFYYFFAGPDELDMLREPSDLDFRVLSWIAVYSKEDASRAPYII